MDVGTGAHRLHTGSSQKMLNVLMARSSIYGGDNAHGEHEFDKSQFRRSEEGLRLIAEEQDITMDVRLEAFAAKDLDRHDGSVASEVMADCITTLKRLKAEGAFDGYDVINIVFVDVMRVGVYEIHYRKLLEMLKNIDKRFDVKTIKEWGCDLPGIMRRNAECDRQCAIIEQVSSRVDPMSGLGARNMINQNIQESINEAHRMISDTTTKDNIAHAAIARGKSLPEPTKAVMNKLREVIDGMIEEGKTAEVA